MAATGDIFWIPFPGANGIKRRPTVVISSSVYHRVRPDVIVGLITSQIAKATTPTDYVLKDWRSAGLSLPSAFRCNLITIVAAQLPAKSGELSPADLAEVAKRLQVGLVS